MGMDTLLQYLTAYREGKSVPTARCHRAHKHMVYTMKQQAPDIC